MSPSLAVLALILSTMATAVVTWLALSASRLAHERIHRARLAAIEADRLAALTRQSFMDNAHHELKTPLQVINGHLEMLLATGLSGEQETMATQALGATARLTVLVQGLLDLTALADGSYPIHHGWVDLRSLLEETALGYGEAARAKGLALSVEDGLGQTTVWTDGPALQRILHLLLDNALACTDSGQIIIRAESQFEANGVVLSLEVDDSGSGLPEGFEASLAKPFLEGQKALSRPGAMGLGLPLASGLVKALGGELSLAPLRPGTRARIRLSLPATPSREGTSRVGDGVNGLLPDPHSLNPEKYPETP